METIFAVVILIMLAIWAGLGWLNRRLEARLEETKEQLEKLTSQQVLITVEEINGVIYGWEQDTNDFVCQGRTLEEFRQNFKFRFPDCNAAIVDGAEELLGKLKKQLEAIKQNENLSSQ